MIVHVDDTWTTYDEGSRDLVNESLLQCEERRSGSGQK